MLLDLNKLACCVCKYYVENNGKIKLHFLLASENGKRIRLHNLRDFNELLQILLSLEV